MINTEFDTIVIGAGHAGVEAALVFARSNLSVAVFSMSVDNIAYMPCNPHIGGSSKGHLVREIDALGGEMGKAIDRTFLQFRMLNKSKGPAVHSPRAQADKMAYSQYMREKIESYHNIYIKQAEITDVIIEDKKFIGVRTATGLEYRAKVCVLCSGTYLNARCLTGEAITYCGPNGMQSANSLSNSLEKAGVKLRRFKTGTPARMDGSSLDYSKMEIQDGEYPVLPFSFDTDKASVQRCQYPCYLTYTNEKTHEILRNNLHRSPIYAGVIEGIGPRYCPSIEDKVVKFPEKIRHQVFVEPEGLYTNEKYIDGMSSSMPEDVQLEFYRTVPGLENCRIVKAAYAIEYDCLAPGQLTNELELREIKGFYCAGQFNGSSGYEEAAAQGLFAAINATASIKNTKHLSIDRSEGYIGVLVDDLVHKELTEPYRMMTSRAEYRLLLRQDNADIRLREKGYECGLISREQYERLLDKKKKIEAETNRLKQTQIGASVKIQEVLTALGSAEITTGTSLASLICRPELNYKNIAEIDKNRPDDLSDEIIEQVEINCKYEGYIARQNAQVNKFKKLEKKLIPENINYEDISGLRIEARQKLILLKPESIGAALRIGGVNPADINVLLIYMKAHKM